MSCTEYTSSVSITTSVLGFGECILLKSSGSTFSEILFHRGKFKVELWGASGGRTTMITPHLGGFGGYTSGILTLFSPKVFYFYIGTEGTDSNQGVAGLGGYNGGSDGGTDNFNNDCASGGSGGATDMRIVTSSAGNEESLLSRVMVAPGGASAGCFTPGGQAGHGGGLTGTRGGNNQWGTVLGGEGGSQTNGWGLGQGEKGEIGNEAGGSGGGGYWGGFAGKSGDSSIGGGGGGGGSAYVSGHELCISLNNVTKEPLSSYIHPSLISFEDPEIVSGNQKMPLTTNLLSFENPGHKGNGAVRITYINGTYIKPISCKPAFSICHSIFSILTSPIITWS